MAVKTRAQIQAESNVTYIDNSVGSITPTAVRTLNDDWTDSTVFVVETGSMQVGTASLALTASYLSGSIDSASYSAFAVTASYAINFNPQATASYALKAELAVTASHAVTASYASKANLATTSSNALTASYVENAQSASFVLNTISASYAQTASVLLGSVISSSYALTSSFATTASYASNVPATASYASQALSSSYAVTASHALSIKNNINATFNEVTASNVQVLGTASVAFLFTQYISSSTVIVTGSNVLGDASNDVQTLWGTVNVISGPLLVTGSANFQGGVTASILGTASYASQALTASNANTASFVRTAQTASYVLNAVSASFASNVASASYATTASYAQDANLAAVANSALSSNFASSSVSASFASTASFYSGTVSTASFSQTASFVNRLRQNVVISGSLSLFDLSSPFSSEITSDGINQALSVNRNLFVPAPYGITGSGAGITGIISSSYSVSSSYALSSSVASNAATASFVTTAQTASFVTLAQTASYVLNAVSSSFATSASFAQTASLAYRVGTLTGSVLISGSLILTGSASGNVFSGSIASATSSLDFNTGNFFTSLVSGSTFFNVTNIKAGQTVNVLLTTAGALPATASFSSNVRQISGSLYTPTSGSSKTDILTFVSFDTTNVYLVAAKNLI